MDKENQTVMAFSPIERQIDMFGCEIGVSRQWYNETTDILIDINKGVYRKVPEGSVVLTREELAKHDKEIRKETARKIFSRIEEKKKRMRYKTDTYRFVSLNSEILKFEKEFGVEVKE